MRKKITKLNKHIEEKTTEMSLNPLNELKRRLDDDTTPLPKRLCLAKNIVTSHHFPTAPKERIVAEWLQSLMKNNKLSSSDLQKILDWLTVGDFMGDLKSKLIQVVSQYVQKNILQENDLKYIILFVENPKISSQISHQIDNYLTITITLLQFLKNNKNHNVAHSEKLLQNLLKYYKESKKKLEFIVKFLDGANLETIFSYLETECHNTVINVCQHILFPLYKKTYFISYLQTMIRKDNIEELILEKGDNIQSVLKIMDTFFDFPKNRTEIDDKFLRNFIEVFVNCFQKESQIIFAFYIMVTNVLTMKQDYIIPSMSVEPIIFGANDEKIKRNLFLNMLEIILKNEIDINVRLTDTLGEKISKVEMKKNFMSYLQVVMIGQLKLGSKVDRTTLQIIKTALKLDPILIEQQMEQILPPIMTSKKSSNVMESYKEMLNCLIEILFKLSRGPVFLKQILPSLRLNLEACNTDQIKLTQEIKKNDDNGIDDEKLKNKLITGRDVFPEECVETFGKLTTDLMFRQNKELLEALVKDFEEYCLVMLDEEFVSPSTIVLTEVLSSILSSFLRHNKMSDHTVPQNIAEEFWSAYSSCEGILKKFGLAVLKIDNKSLLQSFLNISLAYSQLKLLNIKYSNYKVNTPMEDTTEVFDLSALLPCLTSEEWVKLAGKVDDYEAVLVMENLLLVKTMAIELLSIKAESELNNIKQQNTVVETKSYLIKQLNTNPSILEGEKYYPRVLFSNLDKSQFKNVAKTLVKLFLNDEATEIFNDVAISNNRLILNALVLESAKNVTKCLENCDSLTKALNKPDFEMSAFSKDVNIQFYFNEISMIEGYDEKIKKCIELIKILQVPYLEENYQLTAIFVLLAVKKCCQSKKIKRSIDYVLQNVFELSQHTPDLYQVFPANFIFSFKDPTLIDLMTLKIKTSNQFLVVKCLVEKAVKRVKADSELVKNIVELLMSEKLNKNNSIEAFSDPAFQITCIILPLIVKQKKAITISAFRSILADLQEKLQKTLLDTFKNIDFTEICNAGNTDHSMVESESNMATLNAIAAYTLTLSKYCETTDVQEIQNLDCLWSGLEFFIHNSIQAIGNADSKPHHLETSIQLLNVTLRHIKKLYSHPMFNEKDKLLVQIWNSAISRLRLVFQNDGSWRNCGFLEDLGVTLRLVCELVSMEGFEGFIGDLANLVVLKKPVELMKEVTKSSLTNHLVSKHLWSQCLKANTVGPKCGAMTKLMFQNSRNLKSWIRQHYDSVHNVASKKKRKLEVYSEEREVKIVKVHDEICNILRVELDTLTEVIFAGKKITLDYKFLDTIFELQHMVHYILGFNAVNLKCEVTWQSFFTLFEGSVAILNSLLVSREELLEDRWPNYMQCYRALNSILCERAASQELLEKCIEEKLAETAHSIEKLTQAITKRKKQVSRIAAYTVADICTALEKNVPSRMIRQHLENCVAALLQASDSSYAMAFLKRALAGSVGQMTLTNLYTVYKRYHKYTGNA